MPKLRKSRIQSHFQFKGLRSVYHQPVRKDDVSRIYKVTDSLGVTKKASSNEFWVATALQNFKMEFEFQVSINQGKMMAFGIVLDFLVETTPLPTPMWVHGEFWHSGKQRQEDIDQMQQVQDAMKGQSNPGVEIWGAESSNLELATLAVRRKIL